MLLAFTWEEGQSSARLRTQTASPHLRQLPSLQWIVLAGTGGNSYTNGSSPCFHLAEKSSIFLERLYKKQGSASVLQEAWGCTWGCGSVCALTQCLWCPRAVWGCSRLPTRNFAFPDKQSFFKFRVRASSTSTTASPDEELQNASFYFCPCFSGRSSLNQDKIWKCTCVLPPDENHILMKHQTLHVTLSKNALWCFITTESIFYIGIPFSSVLFVSFYLFVPAYKFLKRLFKK